ncbi:hypothetical protein IIA94_01185 [Patescibacteria group bacterium]|nr:hypothetical protein [Patescibacteria group bacterium]
MAILMLVIGIVVMVVGLTWLAFSIAFRKLTKSEVEMMKKDGKFDGEPEFMRSFRVARAGWDLVSSTRHLALSSFIFIVGVIIMISAWWL